MDYTDDAIFLPLQGEGGVRPKAPAVGAWQSPGYSGLSKHEAHANYVTCGSWYGMRTDDLVVMDCDSPEAAHRWSERDMAATKTWVRKTPRGVHFLYLPTAGSPDGPSADVFGNGSGIDIRAGRTSQIVYFAPGYSNLTEPSCLQHFDPAWLPENYAVREAIDRSNSESWDEVPEGRGNNTMTAFAGAFRKQGMSPVKMAACLSAINRIVMTDDPMPREMILDIVRSVSRYAARPDIDIEVVDDDEDE